MFVALLARGEVAVSRSRSVPERNSASECVASRMVVESTSRLRPRSGKSVKSEGPGTARCASLSAATTRRCEEERRVRAEGCVRRHSNSGTSTIQRSGRWHDTRRIGSPRQIALELLDQPAEVPHVRLGVSYRQKIRGLGAGRNVGSVTGHTARGTSSS